MSDQRACEIVATALNIQSGVTIGDTMATLPAWDSLAHMAIILGIEAERGSKLTADEIASIASVRSVADLLGR